MVDTNDKKLVSCYKLTHGSELSYISSYLPYKKSETLHALFSQDGLLLAFNTNIFVAIANIHKFSLSWLSIASCLSFLKPIF